VTYARIVPFEPAAVAHALAGTVEGLAVRTSGSTGAPREVLLPGEAIRASVDATHAALGGPGRWLLALPPDRVAGAMVWARALRGGTEPLALPAGPFTAEAFAAATDALAARGEGPLYVSLVPTQLIRALASPAGRDALSAYRAVLVGGAPLDLDPAAVPAQVVRTYGASETCGGCVYNGVPLEGVQIRLVDGRIHLAGPMLAAGFADGNNAAFVVDDGVRWWVTNDVGTFTPDGRLSVVGRVDHAITTGGVTVHPARVERELRALPGVADAVVTSLPSPEWGEEMVALVVRDAGVSGGIGEGVSLDSAAVRAALGARLPRAEMPRRVWQVDALPLLESGKIDREGARRRAQDLAAARPGAAEATRPRVKENLA